MVEKINEQWRALERDQKLNLLKIGLCLFMTLFTYPLIRSTTNSLFFVQYGAKSSPEVWLLSVFALSGVVYLYNIFQRHYSVHGLYMATALFSTVLFVGMTLPSQPWSYPMFVWREVYIVLVIHMLFGHMNATIEFQTAKILYGPVGALGSLGGVLGGFATTGLTYVMSTEGILFLGAGLITATSLIFWSTKRYTHGEMKDESINGKTKVAPVNSIRPVWGYVLLMVAIISLTQFVVNLANFHVNLLFDAQIEGKELKTRYWGYIESAINGISLVTQVFILPFLYQKLSLRNVHLGLPIFYSVAAVFGLMIGGSVLLPVTIVFVLYKGLDYSLFSTSKELLYFPLDKVQRYGAKYLNDILAYRAAKAVISLVLIYFQQKWLIDSLLLISLVLWFLCVVLLFRHPLAKNAKEYL